MIPAGKIDRGIDTVLRVLAIGMLLASLVSCSGWISGGTSCTRVIHADGGSASCSGSIERLDGRQLLTFKLRDIAANGAVDARIHVTVTGGVVSVTYRNSSGDRIAYAVTADAPLSFEDKLWIVFIDEAEITLYSQGGSAVGIQYAAEFTR